ncbi:MAG: dockerin type I domain-containing protein [Patescibacteria group bacterium]|nr:dockerin type I domain-containing protein [Patescibacteria group bacterium]
MNNGKKFNKIGYLLGGLVCLLAIFFISSWSTRAANLYEAYDLIGTSRPATSTNHLLNFITAQAIPPGGKIKISLADNGLNIPAGFDYSDLDLAVAASGTDIFLDRQLAGAASGSADGIAANTGLGGKIIITLNSSSGIAAHSRVRIKIGTNAVFGAPGSKQILNAAATGSYWLDVKTYSAADVIIDNVRTFVAMVSPVFVNFSTSRIRSNGLPNGVLAAGTTQTIMSLTTNYSATCRYSAQSGTAYSAMTGVFYTSDNLYHTILLTGLYSSHCFDYYVRCVDTDTSTPDLDDYLIHFCVASTGESGTGGGTGGGSGGGTGGGTGIFKPFPLENTQLPSVALSGFAYPGSSISVLQDSELLQTIIAKPDAGFLAEIFNLKKGIYTFTLIAKDTEGTKSIAFPTTFWIEANTQTNVTNILIPPTIKLANTTVELGQNIIVSGQSAPQARVIAQLNDPSGKKILSANKESVGPDGRWSSIFSTTGLSKGIYELTALTSYPKIGSSTLSAKVQCGVGQKLDQGPCSRSDINQDGKINLVDFSIMMYYWGTNNATADINQDGKINLVDFSILMYCWTG